MKQPIIFGLMLILMLSLAHAQVVGLGVSPSVVSFSDVLIGGSMQKQLTVYNTGEQEVTVTLVPSSHQEWFSFSQSSLTIAGGSSVPVIVTVNVPKGESTEKKVVKLQVSPQNKKTAQEGANVGLAVGISSQISIEPTTEKKQRVIVDKIVAQDAEQRIVPPILVRMGNAGNVPVEPDVVIDIKKGNRVVETVKQRLSPLHVGNTQEYDIGLPSLEPLFYSADVKVLLDGTEISSKTVTFNVYEGAIPSRVTGHAVNGTSPPVPVWLVVVGLVGVIVIGVCAVLLRRK